MFAPYCSTCETRVLLGSRRVVATSTHEGRPMILVRCHCGTVIDALNEVEPVAAPAPHAADDRQVRSAA
ncbi:MAG: hypothetical protein ACHQDC_07615 [Acidimicrobiales bacterium]